MMGRGSTVRSEGMTETAPEVRAGRPIVTERLELVAATPELVRAALAGPEALGRSLGAAVPATWPPEHLDEAALRFTLDRLAEGPEQAGWWLHFVVLRQEEAGRVLVGSAGYAGPPAADGAVEVGYAIVSDQRRRGYASEAVRGLLARALRVPGVERVVAHTLPSLAPSIGVLEACGFHFAGESPEPGVVRFELARSEEPEEAG